MKGLLFISHQTERYDYLQSIDIALRGGCRQIQLRMKDVSSEEVEKVGIQAIKMCDQYGARLFIDDHVNACLNVGATGVHLGKFDMPPDEARKILGEDFVIGGTANTIEDIIQLKAAGVDYIGLGPFRFTTTKKNLSPILGLEGYHQIIRQCREHRINLPIIAIGGITISNIPDILNTGVSCIALSSTILAAENPVEETKKIISVINKYKL